MTTSDYDLPFKVLFEKIAKNRCAEDARADAEALLVAVLRFLGCPEKVAAAALLASIPSASLKETER